MNNTIDIDLNLENIKKEKPIYSRIIEYENRYIGDHDNTFIKLFFKNFKNINFISICKYYRYQNIIIINHRFYNYIIYRWYYNDNRRVIMSLYLDKLSIYKDTLFLNGYSCFVHKIILLIILKILNN